MHTHTRRPNRVNPNNNLVTHFIQNFHPNSFLNYSKSKFNCPIPFTMDNDIPFTWGPTPTYSSRYLISFTFGFITVICINWIHRTCDKNDHCEYRNVCYDPSIKAVNLFESFVQNGNMAIRWPSFKDQKITLLKLILVFWYIKKEKRRGGLFLGIFKPKWRVFLLMLQWVNWM